MVLGAVGSNLFWNRKGEKLSSKVMITIAVCRAMGRTQLGRFWGQLEGLEVTVCFQSGLWAFLAHTQCVSP